MGKLLFFLVFVLCLNSTLQAKGTGTHTPLGPGSFPGDPSTLPPLKQNGTQAPFPHCSPPPLVLRSQSIADYLNGTLSTRVIPIIYIFVVAVGVPANVAILCILATKIRKVSLAILYCSLAVSDLFLLLSLCFKAHYHLNGNHWELGEAACRVVTACFYGNLYCSALMMACISMNRYLAVVHPFMYQRLPKRMCTAWVTLVVWGMFGAAIVPDLIVNQSYCFSEPHRITCHDVLPQDKPSHKFLLYYDLCLTIFGLVVPLVITVVCYARIICELNKSHLDWMMYIKASSLVSVIFLVCFTPAGLLHLLQYMPMSEHRKIILIMFYNVSVCLCCLHACLDPFLFKFMSKSAGSKPHLKSRKSKTESTYT